MNTHYTDCKIQPWEYIHANGLDYFEGNVIKYVTRWRKKGGADDLRKAIAYLEEMIRQQPKSGENLITKLNAADITGKPAACYQCGNAAIGMSTDGPVCTDCIDDDTLWRFIS